MRFKRNRGSSGYLIFIDTKIPFNSVEGHNYLISEDYFDKIVEISKFVGNLYEDIYSDSADTDYPNSIIQRVYRTTNFPGVMEVCFSVNIPVEKVREMKLNLLICD